MGGLCWHSGLATGRESRCCQEAVTWETRRGNQVALGRQPERRAWRSWRDAPGRVAAELTRRTRFVHKKEVSRAERRSSQGAVVTAAPELPWGPT